MEIVPYFRGTLLLHPLFPLPDSINAEDSKFESQVPYYQTSEETPITAKPSRLSRRLTITLDLTFLHEYDTASLPHDL